VEISPHVGRKCLAGCPEMRATAVAASSRPSREAGSDSERFGNAELAARSVGSIHAIRLSQMRTRDPLHGLR
jgi:hypothetical protein